MAAATSKGDDDLGPAFDLGRVILADKTTGHVHDKVSLARNFLSLEPVGALEAVVAAVFLASLFDLKKLWASKKKNIPAPFFSAAAID